MPLGERGGAAVELALVLPLVLLVVVAVAETAVVARLQLGLVAATREGARVAATRPDPAEAVRAVQGALGGAEAARVRVAVVRPEAVGSPAEVTTTLSHRVTPAVFGGWTVTLRSRAVMRVER